MTTPKEDQNELDAICGKSAFLDGEDEKAFDRLFAQLHSQYLPKTFSDRLRIREMADTIWEKFRFKRLGTRLVGAGYREALQALVAPCVGYMTHKANELARDYYSDSPKRRELAKAQLDAYGITDDQIQAKALSMIAPEFGFLDGLVAKRNSWCSMLVKENMKEEKRTKKSARETPRSLNDNSDVSPGLPPRNLKRRGEV